MAEVEQPDVSSVQRETLAMREIAKTLSTLEPDERRRVIDWARRFVPPANRGA